MISEPLISRFIVRRRPPANLAPEDDVLFRNEYERTFPAVHILTLRGVNLTAEGVLFRHLRLLKTNIVSDEFNEFYPRTRYLLARYVVNRCMRLPDGDNYLVAYDSWSNGYFHWMCDVLQKMYAARNILPYSTLILPCNFTLPFIRASLESFPVGRIFTLPEKTYLSAREINVIQPVAPSGNYHLPSLAGVVSLLKKRHLRQSPLPADRIFVSRRRAGRRKIVNEEEVIQLCIRHGFQPVCFEDFPFEDQISLAHGAKYLIGLHGAGLTNMMFMQPGSRVMELKAEHDHVNHCYFSLASACDIKYFYHFCIKQKISQSVQDADVAVYLPSFENALLQMLRQ